MTQPEQPLAITYKFNTCRHPKCSPCRAKNYESLEIDFVCGYLDRVAEAGKLNGVFVDIGAHVGLWSLQMSEWYQCRYNIKPIIYALEPESANFVVLKRNATQAETGIIPMQLAAWNKNMWLALKLHDHPARHEVVDVVAQSAETLRVQGVALDNMANSPENRQLDAIKIDVEGAELNVLNGARQILMENEQLLVVLEYHTGHFARYGATVKQMTGFMEAHDYRPVRPIDKRMSKHIRDGQFARVIFVKGDIT